MTQKKLIIILMIALSPAAYYFGGKLLVKYDTTANTQFNIDRSKAILVATQFAQTRGVNITGWKIFSKVTTNNNLYFYYRSKRLSKDDPIRKALPEVLIYLLFKAPDNKQNFEIVLNKDGQPIGYTRNLTDTIAYSNPGDQKAKVIAEESINNYLNALGLRSSSSLEIKLDNVADDTIRSYSAKFPLNSFPDIDAVIKVNVRGDSVVAENINVKVKDEYVNKVLNPKSTFKTILQVLFFVVVIVLVVYGIYRFIQKLRQKELSYIRSAIVMILVSLSFSSFILSSDVITYDLQGNIDFTGPSETFIFFQAMMGYALGGMLIGMAYAGIESDIREAFRKKLVSLDAVLNGKIFSANFSQSLIIGIAAGGYILLLGAISVLPFYKNPIYGDDFAPLDTWIGNYPWLFQIVMIPIHTITVVGIGFIMPLPLILRLVGKNKYSKILIPVLSALVLWLISSPLYVTVRPWYSIYIPGIVNVITILLLFYKFDLVTAIISFASAGFMQFSMLILVQPSSTLHSEALKPIIVLTALIVPFIYFAFKGRMFTEKEVQPVYAGRQFDRIRLLTEVHAAREAQTRLMPVKLPKDEYFSISASHIPAYEVGGDFYDFFEIEPGKIGIFIADGKANGLSSALSIAFAKGFLTPKVLNNIEAANSPAHLLGKLSDRMTYEFSDGIDNPEFTFLLIDAHAGTVKYARNTSHHSVIAVSKDDLTINFNEQTVNGSIIEGTGTIQNGDRIILYTRGVTVDAPITETLKLLKSNTVDKALKKRFKAAGRKGLDNDMTVIEVKI